MGNRVLFPLDMVDGRSSDDVLERETKKGTVPRMETGDMFVGHRGRAYFNKHGDVTVFARGMRASLDLKCEKAKAELYGYNYELSTPGKNVRIHTKSTVSSGPLQTWGDSVYIEVNAPLAVGSMDTLPDALQTNLGRLKIENTGSLSLEVLPLSLNASLSADITGQIELGRGYPIHTVGLLVSPVGTDRVTLFTPTAHLLLDSVTNEVTLRNSAQNTQLQLTAAGDMSMLGPVGDFNISAAGDLTYTGKSVDIQTTASALISAASSLNLQAQSIAIGAVAAGHVTIAELLAPIWAKLDAICILLATHVHPTAVPGPASVAPSLAVLAVPQVVPLGTAALIGSTTVTTQA